MHGEKRYTLAFLSIGAGLAALAVIHRGAAWVLLWPGAAFLAVAAAYFRQSPKVFGKRPDGTMAWPPRLLFLPYLLATWALWRVHRLISRGRCCGQVAPGLWVGRRPLGHELPEGASLVVDMTAEFVEPRGVVSRASYRCLPTLDATAPAREPFLSLVGEIAGWPGGVYVHCANGYGRSAVVAAAVMMAKGLAADAEQAVALLVKARPKVSLSRSQRDLLMKVAGLLAANARPHGPDGPPT